MNEYGIDRIQRGNTQLATWIDEGETVVISRDGKPIAVVISHDEWLAAQELWKAHDDHD